MFRRRAPKDEGPPTSGEWSAYLNVLRSKWDEVPAGKSRRKTTELELLDDAKLMDVWRTASREASESREWYRTLYEPILRGRTVLDVGSGFGIDGIGFAQNGAKLTFLDIAESNLRVLRRLCVLLGVQDADFCYLDDAGSLDHLGMFDFFWCRGR